jgi:beta-glucosidase-like glycosyl hydrolase/CubicO group peptidase (beta-lactamase class C family)
MHHLRLLLLLSFAPILGCGSSTPELATGPRPPVVRGDTLSWVDSVLGSMTLQQKVGQMIMVDAFGHYTSEDGDQFVRLTRLVREEKVGGLILRQSDVYETAILLNRLQQMATVPLLVSADMERGPAMRVRRTTSFPDAMAIGATGRAEYAYAAGRITAEEMRAIGVHQNYAPVADVNTNPANPVINTRAFSDHVGLVQAMVNAYVNGTRDGGGISTVKHFPGHGDTGIDSHLELPIIALPRARLDSVELAPFQTAIDSGVPSVMVSHLSVLALDSTGAPASISPAAVTRALRQDLRFRGLVVTDAMEMRGLTHGYSVAQSTVMAVQAGVDIVLMPPDELVAMTALLSAVRSGDIEEARINASVRKILEVKHSLGLDTLRTVALEGIGTRVATNEHRAMAKEIARHAITVLANDHAILPLRHLDRRTIAVVVLNDVDDNRSDINRPGPSFPNEPTGSYFTQLIQSRNGSTQTIRLTPDSKASELDAAVGAAGKADLVMLTLYVKVRTSSGRIGIPENMRGFVERLKKLKPPLVVVSFGNPYVVDLFPTARGVVCSYGDAEPLVEATVEALFGEIPVAGKLPVTISRRFPFESGLAMTQTALLREDPSLTGYPPAALRSIEDVVIGAIRDSAFPGGQVVVVKNGSIVEARSFGTYTYEPGSRELTMNSMFDLASLTKVIATTAAVMKLVDDGRLHLDDPVGRYLPQFSRGAKGEITVRHLLTHRGGFPPFRKFYELCSTPEAALDSVLASPLVAHPGDTTIYSDIGMMTLGKVVERIVGLPLAEYVSREYYDPLGMSNTMFNPPQSLQPRIAPTEIDTVWRKRLVHGTVHDENAALLGGVSGHAGLFSSAMDLAKFMQMLLNRGSYGGRQYLSPSTVDTFLSARGPGQRFLGWDFKSPTGSSAGDLFSDRSYGHTGFTGTSIWVDPQRELFVVFLTNRVYPTRANTKIYGVRRALHDAVIRALETPVPR